MRKHRFALWMGTLVLGCLGLSAASAQQSDVPEPAFVGFTVNGPYRPVYRGRDPFKPLGSMDRNNLISIGELQYHGVIKMGNDVIALFSWRGNAGVRYTLKSRKLYKSDDARIDGVVGDITETEVVLIQGDRKIVYPRTQRRP